MAITLVETPGASDANTYATLAEFKAFIVNELNLTRRTSLQSFSADDQSRALLLATSLLDRYVDWIGYVASNTQSLSWPRSYAYNHEYVDVLNTEIPPFIKTYTCEVASWLLDNAGAVPLDGAGQVSEIRLGSLALVLNNDAGLPSTEYLPKSVVEALMPVGKYTPGSPKSARSISLVRS